MSTAFNDQERAAIRAALWDAARACACTIGMKKTTLEHLTQQAGISKSAFYGFYESKEHLFLEVYARWHEEIYESARAALTLAQSLPACERAERGLQAACLALLKSDMLRFAEEDWPALERRLPAEATRALVQKDTEMVNALIAQADISLTIPLEEASAVVRILMASLRLRPGIGVGFDAAIALILHAVCARYIRP